jgi:hypothetical protein
MIGGVRVRRATTAIVIGLVVGLGFGIRSADPSLADPPLEAARARALAQAAAHANDALESLAALLSAAIDRARKGAALTVAGDQPPAPEFAAAADLVEGKAGEADAAHRAVEALIELASSISPATHIPALPLAGPDLLLAASGLRTSADAATLFVERRHATDAIVSALGEALASLDANLPVAAITSLDRTVVPLALLDAWADKPPLLGYWRKVTGELIDAARGIARATIAGDVVAQRAAAQRYAKAAEAARGADNALAVSLAEEGNAVSVVELRRLAAAAGAVADERAAVQSIIAPGA